MVKWHVCVCVCGWVAYQSNGFFQCFYFLKIIIIILLVGKVNPKHTPLRHGFSFHFFQKWQKYTPIYFAFFKIYNFLPSNFDICSTKWRSLFFRKASKQPWCFLATSLTIISLHEFFSVILVWTHGGIAIIWCVFVVCVCV